jgi:hypothetical protein
MQSPINLVAPNPNAIKTSPDFGFEYKFESNLPARIVKNSMEVVIKFPTSFAGGMKIIYGLKQIMAFTVEFISFKFPAEHTQNDSRYDGEFVIHMKHITANDDRVNFLINFRKLLPQMD